jgi:hypothetical protein
VTLSDNQPPAYSIIPWERAAQNCASYGGFVAMTGGPHGRCLPKHEHPDLQISVCLDLAQCRLRASDREVAAQHQFAPTAECRPVYGSDHWDR